MKKLIVLGVLLVLLLGWAIFSVADWSLPADGSDAEQIGQAGNEEFMTGTNKEPTFVDVPILIYHHISDVKAGYTTSAKFRKDMLDLKAAGYEAIFYDDLYEYVYRGGDLPQKPIIISFDDGYMSNYELVYPVLQETGMKMELSLIGCLVGKVMGEAHWKELASYVTWSQAREMQESGLVRFQTHTYKMHQCQISGESDMLTAVMDDEGEYDFYVRFFKKDDEKMRKLLMENLGYTGITYTYPLGKYDEVTEALITELGYKISVGVEVGINRVERGKKETLRTLRRISGDNYEGDIIELLQYVEREAAKEREQQ